MDYLLAGGYTVQEEVLVGKLPLRVDILLIRREDGELSEASRRDLSVLVPLLNRYTLVEFKGPTDSVEAGDAAQLFGCSFLWHSQQTERIPREDISLIILAPTANEALVAMNCAVGLPEPGSTSRECIRWPAPRSRPGWWKRTSWPDVASPSCRWSAEFF